jgi:hypothetical protein
MGGLHTRPASDGSRAMAKTKRNAYSTVFPISEQFRMVVRRSNFVGWCIWQQIPHSHRGGWRNYTYHGSYDDREAAEQEADRLTSNASDRQQEQTA